MLESFLNKVAGLQVSTLLKKETTLQVFPCELCEISKHTFLQNTSGDWARVLFWVGGYLYVLFFLIYKMFLCFVVCCIFYGKMK